TVQTTAASGSGSVFNVAAPQANILTAVDTLGDVGQYASITVAPDGLPVMSYSDATNGDLKVAKCGNAACSSGNTLTAVDTPGLVGRYSSIAIGADGLPVISYDDQSNGTVKVAKCGNAACSLANTLTTVASTGRRELVHLHRYRCGRLAGDFVPRQQRRLPQVGPLRQRCLLGRQ
ncbi:MAG: hypothetical protein IPO58_22910, partial [Betaproteobacteria bacterium]|nr:hypothetical protein [Betaproteobacteria bacterium]